MLKTHLQTFNLLSDFQWGFGKQRSTEDLLLHITELWHQTLDEDKTVVVLFIDFQKAFDSVSHEILLKKLSASRVSGALYEYLLPYLENRTP